MRWASANFSTATALSRTYTPWFDSLPANAPSAGAVAGAAPAGPAGAGSIFTAPRTCRRTGDAVSRAARKRLARRFMGRLRAAAAGVGVTVVVWRLRFGRVRKVLPP